MFCYFHQFSVVLGDIISGRQNRDARRAQNKTERVNIAPDIIFRPVRAVTLKHMTTRGSSRDFGIPFSSLARYCSKASEEDVRGISRNSVYSTLDTANLARTAHIYVGLCTYIFTMSPN